MESCLLNANVVIAARQFNPTIFDQLWLIDNGVASREDFPGGESFTLTPPFVQFRSPRFVLIVLPEQLQFAPQPVDNESGQLVAEKVGKIVSLLPQTPYVAIGLNFHWQLTPDPSEYERFCRALFFRDNPLYRDFDVSDAQFGGYLSRDVLGTRLNLDIKPRKTAPTQNECLQLMFNFNLGLSRRDAVEQIGQILGRWDEAREYACQAIHRLEGWQWK